MSTRPSLSDALREVAARPDAKPDTRYLIGLAIDILDGKRDELTTIAECGGDVPTCGICGNPQRIYGCGVTCGDPARPATPGTGVGCLPPGPFAWKHTGTPTSPGFLDDLGDNDSWTPPAPAAETALPACEHEWQDVKTKAASFDVFFVLCAKCGKRYGDDDQPPAETALEEEAAALREVFLGAAADGSSGTDRWLAVARHARAKRAEVEKENAELRKRTVSTADLRLCLDREAAVRAKLSAAERDLFNARQALLTEGVARNAAERERDEARASADRKLAGSKLLMSALDEIAGLVGVPTRGDVVDQDAVVDGVRDLRDLVRSAPASVAVEITDCEAFLTEWFGEDEGNAEKTEARQVLRDCTRTTSIEDVAKRLRACRNALTLDDAAYQLASEVLSFLRIESAQPRDDDDRCEGCDKPATTIDNVDDAVPLCAACKASLIAEPPARFVVDVRQLFAAAWSAAAAQPELERLVGNVVAEYERQRAEHEKGGAK